MSVALEDNIFDIACNLGADKGDAIDRRAGRGSESDSPDSMLVFRSDNGV